LTVSPSDTLNLLDHLFGERLSAVTFIHDYFQLVFGDQTVTVYPPISISRVDEEELILGSAGFRDALCEQMGQTLVAIYCTAEEVSMQFSSKYRVVIPLHLPNSTPYYPERLVARAKDGTIVVINTEEMP